MTAFNPFPQAAPDFTDPLGLLRACHGRILGHCETLARLLPHLAAQGADAEAREAMARVHRYFSTAARHHHEDEETDLFPMLGERDGALAALIAGLEREHGELARRWSALEPLLTAPEEAASSHAAFALIVGQFIDGYRAHAAKENELLLPRAAQLLAPADLARLGAAMARRRGISL